MKRIPLFIIGVLLLLSSCENQNDGKKAQQPVSYSFFVAGHTYGKPGIDNCGLHPPFKKRFDLIRNNNKIELGFLTGDIVINGSENNWDEVDADLDVFDFPIHFAVGNHDMKDRELYESRYGRTYFSFKHRSDLFIVLDPNLNAWNISDDQLKFLKSILIGKTLSVDHIFVFFHQVLWWDPDNKYGQIVVNSTEGRAKKINFRSEVEPLFSGLEIPVTMFAGDVGAFNTGSEYTEHRHGNITYITSGMGSGVKDNFVQVNIHEDQSVSYSRIDLN